MSNFGHNEAAVRLAALAGDAQIALDKVARGEADAIDGWLAYGAALNEGRALFNGDTEFGKWVAENSLRQLGGADIHDHERAAAMWAAANADQLAEAKANSKARTLRGWHDQWKKIEKEREAAIQKAEREAEEARKREEAEKARQEAQAQAKAEAEARAAAVAAKNDAERKEAEARAEAAKTAKEAADKAAVEAELAAEPEEEPEQIEPDVEKVMRKYAGLTREALLRDYAELVVASRSERAALKAEIEGLKSKIALFEAEGDIGRKLGMALRERDTLNGRLSEYMQIAKREEYKRKKAEARVAELERMEIPLC